MFFYSHLKFSTLMISNQQAEILFISTFPPKKCGLASFTQDLINAIKPEIEPDFSIKVCVLDKKVNASLYGYPVTMVMDSFRLASCMETAVLVNKDPSVKLICIEHEFG